MVIQLLGYTIHALPADSDAEKSTVSPDSQIYRSEYSIVKTFDEGKYHNIENSCTTTAEWIINYETRNDLLGRS